MLRAHTALAGVAALIVAGAGCGRVGYRTPAGDAHGMDAAIPIDGGRDVHEDASSEAPDAEGTDAGPGDDAGTGDAGPPDAGPEGIDAGPEAIDAGPGSIDGGPDAGSACECTPGETRTCSDCRPDTATSTCTAACRWGTCLTTAGEPCGACTDGALHCNDAIGRAYTCESGRWICSCACTGGTLCC